MARVLTAKEICERSLRQIGAFPVTESAADGEHLREAMFWLDLIMGNTVGVNRIFSRVVPATLPLPLENGTGSYNLNVALGEDLPEDRIQFVIDAYLEDGSGRRTPLTIVTRKTFEDVCQPGKSGPPLWVYVGRDAANPTLKVYPTPEASDPAEYVVHLVVQQYSPNVAPAGITGTQPSGTVLHQFNEAWQLWLVVALSHAIGTGPVYALPAARIKHFAEWAEMLKKPLLSFQNQEHDTEQPIAEPWGG